MGENRKYKRIFEAMVDPVAIVDSKGIVIDVSESVEKVTGFKKQDIVGKNFAELDVLTEKSKETFALMLPRRLKGEKISPYEVEVKTRQGKKIPMEVNAVKIELEDEPAVMIVFRQVAERKEMENILVETTMKYLNLVEHSPDGIVVVQDHKIKFLNSKMAEILGYRVEDLLGENFLRVIAPEAQESVLGNYENRMAGEDIEPSYQSWLFTKQKKKKPVEVTASLIDFNGRPAVLVFVRDITEKVKARDKMIDSEIKFKALFNSLVDPVVLLDDNNIVVEASKSVGELIGLDRKDLLGERIYDLKFFSQLSKDVIKKRLTQIKRGMEVPPFLVDFKKGKEKKHAEINYKHIRYDSQKCLMITFREV
jgi:PAS domain S-box-containing protein